MTPEENLYKYLKNLNITYSAVEHEAFFTCEASGDFYEQRNMGADCKTLFLRNRKGKKHYMVVMLSYKKLDIPSFAKSIEEHHKMSFASAERLLNFVGLVGGSVTPFGLLHENAGEVEVYIDKEIFLSEYVHFHPLRNTATIKLSTKSFKKYLESLSQNINFYAF